MVEYAPEDVARWDEWAQSVHRPDLVGKPWSIHAGAHFNANEETQPGRRRRPRRVFLWFFLALQVLFIVWIIAGTSSGHPNCTGQALSVQDCTNAYHAGQAIGVGVILLLWAVTDVIVGGGYAVYRLAKKRP